MSGQKKLDNATRDIRVVAIPSRKREVTVGDKTAEVQLYNIVKMC